MSFNLEDLDLAIKNTKLTSNAFSGSISKCFFYGCRHTAESLKLFYYKTQYYSCIYSLCKDHHRYNKQFLYELDDKEEFYVRLNLC